jgi:hypothetical protein
MFGWNWGKRLWSKSLLKRTDSRLKEHCCLVENRGGAPGQLEITRLLFDRPQTIRTIRLLFKEYEVRRTQEFVLRSLPHGTRSWKDVVRQQ